MYSSSSKRAEHRNSRVSQSFFHSLLMPRRGALIGVTRGKPLAQSKTIHWRGMELGKIPKRRGNEIDLIHIGTAMGAGREMQSDPNFGQDGNAVV